MRKKKQKATEATLNGMAIEIGRNLQIATAVSLPLEESLMSQATQLPESSDVTESSAIQTWPSVLSRFSLLTTEQAAAYLNLTKRFLEERRLNGRGPRFVRVSQKCIRYRMEDLDAWVTGKLKSSTAEA